ncbi:MAG: DNA-processing protein DprA [Acidimicrobiia bacterium]
MNPADLAPVGPPAVDERLVAAAALVALPKMRPERLSELWKTWPDPLTIVLAIRSEIAAGVLRASVRDATGLVRHWRSALDLEGTETLIQRRGTHVLVAGTERFPIEDGIEHRPTVLLAEGARADAFDRPRVAVVGTRAATPHGLADAYELGGVLARAGVTVVSGLAIGIDAAAHEGALDAHGTVIGVLGTGLDVVYPRRHDLLHRRVRNSGLLVSEYRHGTGPHQMRFPQRNRIIAGLSDVVVVVEATQTGGARITAQRAVEYGRDVCAYPGSRRNPSARGSNELLRDSAHLILDPEDVLGIVGLTPGDRRTSASAIAVPGTLDEHAVITALGGEAATVDEITARSGLSPGTTAMAVAGLVRAGLIRRANGLLWPM